MLYATGAISAANVAGSRQAGPVARILTICNQTGYWHTAVSGATGHATSEMLDKAEHSELGLGAEVGWRRGVTPRPAAERAARDRFAGCLGRMRCLSLH